MDEDYEEPVERKRIPEPVTFYDFCKEISKVLKKDVGYVLGRCKGYNMDCFYQMQSDCKLLRTHEAKVKYLMWFLRESKLKESQTETFDMKLEDFETENPKQKMLL